MTLCRACKRVMLDRMNSRQRWAIGASVVLASLGLVIVGLVTADNLAFAGAAAILVIGTAFMLAVQALLNPGG